MPGCPGDFSDIKKALADGELKHEELKECVRCIITIIYQTLEFEGCKCYLEG